MNGWGTNQLILRCIIVDNTHECRKVDNTKARRSFYREIRVDDTVWRREWRHRRRRRGMEHSWRVFARMRGEVVVRRAGKRPEGAGDVVGPCRRGSEAFDRLDALNYGGDVEWCIKHVGVNEWRDERIRRLDCNGSTCKEWLMFDIFVLKQYTREMWASQGRSEW